MELMGERIVERIRRAAAKGAFDLYTIMIYFNYWAFVYVRMCLCMCSYMFVCIRFCVCVNSLLDIFVLFLLTEFDVVLMLYSSGVSHVDTRFSLFWLEFD